MVEVENFHNTLKESLTKYGYNGKDLCEARNFLEEKINEFWVDAPIGYRSDEAKEMAKKCSSLKKLKKELSTHLKANNLKMVYDNNIKKYIIK